MTSVTQSDWLVELSRARSATGNKSMRKYRKRDCVCQENVESFAQLYKTTHFVIPVKTGIQYYQWFPGYRPTPA